jgi:hypothetical protein
LCGGALSGVHNDAQNKVNGTAMRSMWGGGGLFGAEQMLIDVNGQAGKPRQARCMRGFSPTCAHIMISSPRRMASNKAWQEFLLLSRASATTHSL